MTKTHIGLVQASWKMVAENGTGTTGSLLYRELTTILPELADNMSLQEAQPSRKIIAIVNHLIRSLHDTVSVINTVEDFSRRHLPYALHDEQFIRAGRSLLDILSANLGDKWNSDIEQAWLNCYITLAEAMMLSNNAAEEPIYYC